MVEGASDGFDPRVVSDRHQEDDRVAAVERAGSGMLLARRPSPSVRQIGQRPAHEPYRPALEHAEGVMSAGNRGADRLHHCARRGAPDELFGGAGNDTLDGGADNDRLYGDRYGVQLSSFLGTPALINSEQNVTAAQGGVDVLLGGAGDDELFTVYGADVLDGGTGVDLFGLDRRWSSTGLYIDVATLGGAAVLVDGVSVANVERLEVYGGTATDLLNGGVYNDFLDGGDGDDVMLGKGGNDVIVGGAGSDVIDGGEGDDVLVSGADTLNDIVYGGAGNDQINGHAGDTLRGGEGRDLLEIDFVDVVGGVTFDMRLTESGADVALAGGTILQSFELARVYFGDGNDVVTAGAEALEAHGGGGADVIVGSVMNDNLRGDAGDDLLIGGLGADYLEGGVGYDTVSYEGSLTGVSADLYNSSGGEGGTPEGVFDDSFSGIERLIGSSHADVLYGDDGHNRLEGRGGDDILQAHFGADELDGGEGFDIVTYQDNSFGVQVNLALEAQDQGEGGVDRLFSIEGARGSAFDDTLVGSSGANLLEGLDGADTLFGGDGLDTLRGGVGNDVLVGNAQIFAADADVLWGDEGGDLIYGEAADNLNGGEGFDSLIAVNGFDFTLNMAAASIEYAVLEFGNDKVDASAQTVGVSVFASGGKDSVTGSAVGDLIFGGVGDDVINAGDGADSIVGEAGVDQLNGGAGDDRIYFDGQDSLVFGGAGYDAGYITASAASGATINMGLSGLEYLQDTAGGNDTILGSTAAVGLTVYAGGGTDLVEGSAQADVLWGQAGTDTLRGGGGADVLVGGADADVLAGGAGNDALFGSSGSGGDGASDRFVFTQTGAANADTVYDFEHNVDKLDFSAFSGSFANVGFANVGADANVYMNGQLVCTVVGGAGVLTAGDFIFAGAAPFGPDLGPAAGEPGAQAGDDHSSFEAFFQVADGGFDALRPQTCDFFGPAFSQAFIADLI